MKTKSKNKISPGFSLIELLIVMAIIGILASVVLTNLSGESQEAKDAAALQSLTSAAPEAYRCLLKGYNNVRIYNFSTANPMCCYQVGLTACDTWAPGFPTWPDVAEASGWDMSGHTGVNPVAATSPEGFYWCNVSGAEHTRDTHPTSSGTYLDGTRGGDKSTGNFCYMVKKGTSSTDSNNKYIWCTESGCKKSGF